MVTGGAGGTYLYRWDKRFPALLAGSMAILGCFPFWGLLNLDVDSSPMWLLGGVSLLAGVGSGVTGPIIKATLQNVTHPESRGQAFALFNTFDDFGRGLGPVFVALMISNVGGRQKAFNLAVFGWVVCGVVNLCVFFTAARDELALQARITSSLVSSTGYTDIGHEVNGTEGQAHNLLSVSDPATGKVYTSLRRRSSDLDDP